MLAIWFILAVSATLGFSESVKLSPVAVYHDVVSQDSKTTMDEVVLSNVNMTVIFDYGREVAGTPYFVVATLGGPVQVEMKYSEELAGLGNTQSDGPFPFSSGLSNTFRVETFNATSTGLTQSYFIQGGQRWQSIRQLTGGELTISEVGFISSANNLGEVDSLPGYFACSNQAYNQIWQLGAQASTLACVNAGTQHATWEITDDGARVRGQKPALSAVGINFVDYTLEFSTNIERGGTGWSVAQTPSSAGLQFLLVSELPEQPTFVNTNTAITPRNSLVVAYGYSFVNQTTLPSTVLTSLELQMTVKEGQWYDIQTTLNNGTDLLVSIDHALVLNISLSEYGVSLANPFNPFAPAGAGSWGFGPWQDQIALIKDVVVTANNGTTLYENDLRSTNVLSEYGVATNNATVCLDGPKRDRLVWLGDAFHTCRIVPASTARKDEILETLQYLLDWQNEEGLLPIAPPMGYGSIYASNVGGYLGLDDYQTLGLLAYTGYFDLTGDIQFAEQLLPGFRRQASWLISQINETTGLAEIGGFTGPASGTATSAALVQALDDFAVIAAAVGDEDLANDCLTNASRVADAIETLLWNDDLGIYATSVDAESNFSVADISFAITSGVAGRNESRLASLLSALDILQLGPGYKDSSSVSSNEPATNISPNINGFLLYALMMANATDQGKFLLDNLWTAMIANESTTTGASWEYVNARDLSPGLGLFTSLSHPWGGAPTYVLPQWIAGLRPVKAGYEEWNIIPGIDGFNLTTAETRVSTKFGQLAVSWQLVSDSELNVNVTAPQGTNGSLSLPLGKQLQSWSLNGENSQVGFTIQLGPGTWNVAIRFGPM